jgi:hypothetical protein
MNCNGGSIRDTSLTVRQKLTDVRRDRHFSRFVMRVKTDMYLKSIASLRNKDCLGKKKSLKITNRVHVNKHSNLGYNLIYLNVNLVGFIHFKF